MTQERVPPEIFIEDGRLTVTIREILETLGVATSSEESPDDHVVTIERKVDGAMRIVTASRQVRPDLKLLCWSLVAGTNIIGSVDVRVRDGSDGPVFVSLRSTP